jgi:hypothetical protein
MEQQTQDQKALYSPLDPDSRQTRLFTLLPGAPGDPIKGFLTQISLDNGPDYEALSYVWGDPTITVPICLNKGGLGVATYVEFGVTTNLESALRHLRWKDGPRCLWIDAICINQSDTLERNHQVQNMRWVYGAASSVVVWLGKATIYSQRGLNLLSDLMTNGQRFENIDDSGNNKCMLMQQCFRDIVYRNYWQRIWVVQEVALAKIMRLVCGPFSTEIPASGCLERTTRNLQRLEKLYGWDSGFSMSRLLSILKLREERLVSRTLSLWELVWQFRYCKSHDPRDMVFALLGLVSDSETVENNADYTLTMSQVRNRLLHSYILRHGNLRILNYTDELSNTANDPPWVIHSDKSDVDNAWEELQAIRFVPLSSSLPSRFREFNASKDSDPIIRIGSNPDFCLLTIRGFLIGDIDYLGSRYQYNPLKSKSHAMNSSPNKSYIMDMERIYAGFFPHQKEGDFLCRRLISQRKILEEWKHRAMSSKIKPSPRYTLAGTKTLILEAFWRTIMADSISFEELTGFVPTFHAPHQTLRGHKPSKSSGFSRMVEILTDDKFVKDLGTLFKGGANNSVPGTSGPGFNYFVRAVEVAVARRQFFLSNTGWMGLAPTSAVKGDIICILLGGATPFVLRPAGNDLYQLVGECYIHGMMDGEAMEDLEKGKYKEKEITLV